MNEKLKIVISSDRGRVDLCKAKSLKYLVAELIIKLKYKSVKHKFEYLNLGCGSNIYSDFLNADITVNKDLIFKKYNNYIYLDSTKKWNIEDDYFKGIYTEHMLEHLDYTQAIFALSEAFRTLKKDGVIRIVIPSLDRYLDFENINDKNYFKEKFGFRALAISNLTQNAGHVSTWDYELLKYVLESIGFKNVKYESFQNGRNLKLLKDAESRKWASIYVEATK